jgi:hypothetical protein
VVSVERPGRCAGTVEVSAAVAVESAAVAVTSVAPAFTSVVVVPVIKCVTPRVVPVVVMGYVMAMPIGAPVMPAPSITTVEADSEANSEREVWAAIPDSGILVPSWPRYYRTSVNHPWIIGGDVNDFGAGGLNDDRRALRRYGLLLRVLKIALFLRPLAHHLHGIHHILLLVVIGVAER